MHHRRSEADSGIATPEEGWCIIHYSEPVNKVLHSFNRFTVYAVAMDIRLSNEFSASKNGEDRRLTICFRVRVTFEQRAR